MWHFLSVATRALTSIFLRLLAQLAHSMLADALLADGMLADQPLAVYYTLRQLRTVLIPCDSLTALLATWYTDEV
jgi:hypothetical protein